MDKLLHQKVSPPYSQYGDIHFERTTMDKAGMPTKGKVEEVFRFVRVFLLFGLLLLSTTSAMAQSIAGTTSVCVASTTTLSCATIGGTWSSSNVTTATINSAGVVTGIAAGTTTISYTISGIPVTVTLTVNPLPNAGTINGLNAVCILSTITLSDTVGGGIWSANNGITTVGSATGIVTGMAIGSNTVNYTVTNSCGSANAAITITVNGVVGDIYTYGGTGSPSFGGDNGPAYLASMSNPRDLTTDATGNVYFCDVLNHRVRKISTSGIITTIAGNGIAGNTGDGGPATAAELKGPNGVFIDNSGNIFISNTGSQTIRKIDASGIIHAIAGVAGSAGSSGDGGPATLAKFNTPLGVLEDVSGNIYVADQNNNKIRKIDASTGIITTVAGGASGPALGDGGPATAAFLNTVRGLAQDNAGNIYIADANNNRIRKYVPSTGIITTFAGTGTTGHSGDGGPATAATLESPARFAYDGANIIYITDQDNNVIRAVNLATGIITQVAGNASSGFSGDFGPANSAQLQVPAGIAVDFFGNFYIADGANNRIRSVPSTGSISSNITGPTSVCAGTSITLTAFLSGSGSATYQWQKNGSNVGSGGTSYTNTSPVDKDVYRVIVTVKPACSSSYNDTSNDIAISVSPVVSPIYGPSMVGVGWTSTLSDTASGGTWTTSSSSIATISSGGVIAGLTAGTVTVTYAIPGICGINTSVITVYIAVVDTINAWATVHGSISPAGAVPVFDGGTQVFTITADSGYHVTDVLVDSVSVGAITTYTFTSVSGNHTIEAASFAPDCVAPTITCSGDVTQNADADSCSAVVSYSAATATGTSPTITYSQDAGTSFPVGTTMVIATATNTCGTDNCSLNVTVVDNQAPTITAPADDTVYADSGACSAATVALGTPITADNCGVASVTNNAAPPYTTGITIVTWTVTDVHGNTATATQNVNVIDNQNPTITAPADVTVNTDSGVCLASSVSLGTPTTADNCGVASVTNNATPPYAVGTTVVTWTVTDVNGNTEIATQKVTVTDNQAPTITVPGDVTVNADAGACSAATVSLGTPTTADNCGVSTVTNDAAPPYPVGTTVVTWTVTDIHGNTTTAAQNVTVVDTQNPTITAPAGVTVNADSGACSAATASLGTPTTADNCAVATVTNNAAPPYSVGTTVVTWTVTDIHGNTSTATQNVIVVDNQNPTITAPAGVTVNADGGKCTAAIVSLGTPTTADNCGVATVTNNAAPPYSVGTTVVTWTVTDVHGNTSTATQNVIVVDNQNPTITAPGAITVTGYCSPVSVTLGSATTADNCGVASVTNNAPTLFPVGTTVVTWTVTDIHGNTATASQSVTVSGSISLTATTTNVSCNGGSTGGIATSISGGTPAFSYAWNTGATTSGISGIAAGTYSVTVTDAHGCTAGGVYTITQPTALSLAGAVAVNVSCHGSNNGNITTNVTGGTSAYSYTWSTGSTSANLSALTPGTYSVTVTDAHGCIVTGSYTITQPATLALSASVTNAACNGGSGACTTTVTGGTTPYTYLWSNSATTANLAAVAGTYSFTVTDAKGCKGTSSAYTITQPTAISGTATDSNVSCHGGTNGKITTTISGGTPSYSYSWSNGSTVANPSGLAAGTYTLTVTDAHGCTFITTSTVTQPSAISVTGIVTNVNCYGASTGNVNTTVSSGTPPYTYRWSNGSTVADPTGLSARSYSVTVTDAKGCTQAASYTLTQPSSAISSSMLATPVYNISGAAAYTIYLIYGNQTDTISVSASGGTPGYTYSWAPLFGSTTTLSVTSPASTTTYSVTITDALGCTKVDTQTIYIKDIRCAGDGLGKDHTVKKKCIYMCREDGKPPTISVDSADVAYYLTIGYVLDRCHDAHRTSNPEDSSGNGETIVGTDGIKVYPNPTSDGVFNVEIPPADKDAEIQVSDITGRIIERRAITDNSGMPIQFSLGDMVEGMYFVKVNAGDKTYVAKLIRR